MSHPAKNHPGSRVLALVLAAGLFGGCGPRDEIRRYNAPRPQPKQRPPSAASASEEPGRGPRIELPDELPDGWHPGQLVVSRGGIQVRREAAFEVRQDDQRVEITVTGLPAAAGSLLQNVNRWRTLLSLDSISQDEIEQQAQEISLGDVAGDYVQILGPDRAILGVVAVRNDTTWFIKLQGDRELAVHEKEHFEAFVQSLRFSPETARRPNPLPKSP
jgi:hypothetical protein